MREPPAHPASPDLDCTRCGACCAQYRVSFYWAEAAERGLDEALTEPLNPWLSCMKGTSSNQPRCVALAGTIGAQVACTVYAQRPEVCRELQAGQPQCLKARAAHGLPVG